MTRYWADLSNNNAQTVNWGSYQKAGHRLVGLKATEGVGFIDSFHAQRAIYAHNRGVHVAHYHFAHVDAPADAQAKVFWAEVKRVFGKRDYCVLDIEEGGLNGSTLTQTVECCRRFERAFEKLSGHRLIVYSNLAFLRQLRNLGYRPASGKGWIAAYGMSKPSIPGIQTWAWQFTDGKTGPYPHTCAGVGACDISLLNVKSYLWLRATKP